MKEFRWGIALIAILAIGAFLAGWFLGGADRGPPPGTAPTVAQGSSSPEPEERVPGAETESAPRPGGLGKVTTEVPTSPPELQNDLQAPESGPSLPGSPPSPGTLTAPGTRFATGSAKRSGRRGPEAGGSTGEPGGAREPDISPAEGLEGSEPDLGDSGAPSLPGSGGTLTAGSAIGVGGPGSPAKPAVESAGTAGGSGKKEQEEEPAEATAEETAEPEPQPPETGEDRDEDETSTVPTVRMASEASELRVGTSFAVRILIEGAQDVGSVPFHVRFDPAVLRFESGAEGGFLGSDGRETAFLAAPTSSGDTVVVGLSRLGAGQGIAGGGELCTLRFTAIGPGNAGLGFASAKVRDSSNRIVPSVFQPVSLMVRGE